MPVYSVSFEYPVVYLPGHFPAERIVTELVVRAPNEQAAIFHAIRTTQGETGLLQATLIKAEPEAAHAPGDGLRDHR